MKVVTYFTTDREQPYYKGSMQSFNSLKSANDYINTVREGLHETMASGILYLKLTITKRTKANRYIETIYRQELLVNSH